MSDTLTLDALDSASVELDETIPDNLEELAAGSEARTEILNKWIARNLKSGIDYGSIPVGGREGKPSLFKPGAEKLCNLFGWRPAFEPDLATREMAGNMPGLICYVCNLYNRHGALVGEGRGSADLAEKRGWTVNNAIKIAEKRSQIDAVLRTGALSERFSQDTEDATQRVAMEQEQQTRHQRPQQQQAPRQNVPQQSVQRPTAPAPNVASTQTLSAINMAREQLGWSNADLKAHVATLDGYPAKSTDMTQEQAKDLLDDLNARIDSDKPVAIHA